MYELEIFLCLSFERYMLLKRTSFSAAENNKPVTVTKYAIASWTVMTKGELRAWRKSKLSGCREASKILFSKLFLPQSNIVVFQGVKHFLFSTSSRPALGSTYPPIQWVPGDVSPEVKRPGSDADHSPPASAEFRKMWIYIAIPAYAFMA
jgi:hypothetical protein